MSRDRTPAVLQIESESDEEDLVIFDLTSRAGMRIQVGRGFEPLGPTGRSIPRDLLVPFATSVLNRLAFTSAKLARPFARGFPTAREDPSG